MKKIIKSTIFCITFILCLNTVLALVGIEDNLNKISDSAENEIREIVEKLNTDLGRPDEERELKEINIVIATTDVANEKELKKLAFELWRKYNQEEGKNICDLSYSIIFIYRLAWPGETRDYIVRFASKKNKFTTNELNELVKSVKDEIYQNPSEGFIKLIDLYAEKIRKKVKGTIEGFVWSNLKNEDVYVKKQAFLVPDSWKHALSLVPVAVWYDRDIEEYRKYPLLIVGKEEGKYIFPPIVDFLIKYKPDKIIALNLDLKKFIDYIKIEEKAEVLEEKEWTHELYDSLIKKSAKLLAGKITRVKIVDYPIKIVRTIEEVGEETWEFIVSFWPKERWYVEFWDMENLVDIVVVNNALKYTDTKDREITYKASSFASFINAPLMFLDARNFEIVKDVLENRRIHVIGGYLDKKVEGYIKENSKDVRHWSIDEIGLLTEKVGRNPTQEAYKSLERAKEKLTVSDTSSYVAGDIFNIKIEKKESPETYFKRGNELEEQRKFREAIESYKEAVETPLRIRPGYSVSAQVRIANIYFRQEIYDKAFAAYKKAKELFEEIRTSEGDPYSLVLDIKERKYYWMENTKAEAIIQYRLGEIYEINKEYDKAIREYELTKGYDYFVPAQAYERIGEIYWLKKIDHDKATENYENAIRTYNLFSEINRKKRQDEWSADKERIALEKPKELNDKINMIKVEKGIEIF